MADEIDMAQARDQLDRDNAIAATLRRIADAFAPRDARVDGLCVDCDEPIEPERLAVIRTARCADCAGIFERRQRQCRS